MDDDVLFKDPLIIPTPGEEGDIITAPVAQVLHCLWEGETARETILIKTGNFLYLIVHAPEVDRTDIRGELVSDGEIGVEPDGADFDNLAAQVNRKMVKDFGFGTHGLVPFQIQNDKVHKRTPLKTVVEMRRQYITQWV